MLLSNGPQLQALRQIITVIVMALLTSRSQSAGQGFFGSPSPQQFPLGQLPSFMRGSPSGFYNRMPFAGGMGQMGNPYANMQIPPGSSGASPNLIAKINNMFRRGILAGKGDMIAHAAMAEGIDPKLLASIVGFETGGGTSKMIRTKFNPAGVYDSRAGAYKRFPTLYAGLRYTASNLRRNYINKGLTTFAAIARKYAPVGAHNDPNGTNGSWASNVALNYRNLS